jgi:FKBP-type peptidyl-prolyl cis-trans isomerase
MRRQLFAVIGLAVAGVVSAAPVPKAKGKVDPGDPWKFPDLKSAGWVELKDELKVWDVTEGEGDPCPVGATATIHYTGWLADGTEFGSSKKSGGMPFAFPLANLIKGWQEGIPGMKPGGIRRLYIPSELAYGKSGVGGQIPPDATLVFVIELIDVKK